MARRGCGEYLPRLVRPVADGALVPVLELLAARLELPAIGATRSSTRPSPRWRPERDPARVAALLRTAHERLVDDPPWLWIVHDLNPRAMSRRVRGFVSAQSWFQDLTTVELQ